MTSIDDIFRPYARSYEPIIAAARGMSAGNLYMIGGAVYRSLANALHGSPLPSLKDHDFVADTLLPVPDGWTAITNSCGGTKITAPYAFDIYHFGQDFQLEHLKLPLTIDSYLRSVPITTQSIAYDVQRQTIIGPVGIDSITHGLVAVNNPITFELRRARHMPKLITLAHELGFRVQMPYSPQQ